MKAVLEELDPIWSRVLGGVGWNDAVMPKVRHAMSYVHPSAKRPGFGMGGGWDGTVSLLKFNRANDPLHPWFPTGCLHRVAEVLRQNGYEVEFCRDRRPDCILPIGCTISTLPGMFDFQREAVQSWIDYGGYGFIHSVMGSGKTSYIAASAIKTMLDAGLTQEVLFLCERKEILVQARSVLQRQLGQPVGILGGGVCDLQPVTVSTVQSLMSSWDQTQDYPAGRRPKVINRIGSVRMVVVDEGHHASAPIYQTLLKKMGNAQYRLGLSGTPEGNMGLQLLIESVLGPVVYSRPYEFYINLNPPILATPTFWVYHMPTQRGIQLDDHDETSGASKYAAYYRAYVTTNDVRNDAIVMFCRNQAKRGKTVAVLVTRVEHGERLLEMMPEARWVYGSHGEEARWAAFDGLRDGEFSILISTLLTEAIDLPFLDSVVYACAGDSKVAFPQSWRCMRSNIKDGVATKPTCDIMTFVDRAKYLRDHSERQLDMLNHRGFTVRHVGHITPSFKKKMEREATNGQQLLQDGALDC